MIEFRRVHFSIQGNRIIEDASFFVPRGATKVILGPSGSGKSTILRLLIGLARPDSGSILVNGEDITRVDEDRLREIRRTIGMVFQQGALFDSMTVGENVGYSLLEHGGEDEDAVDAVVRSHLELVGLDPALIDWMPDQLSGGMQRRVAIARALAARDPNILLYDEPTTGLDPPTAERITELIMKLRDRMGKTSVVVTHDIADALKIGDRIVVIDGGRVRFEGSPAELIAADIPFIRDFLSPFRKSLETAARQFNGREAAGGGRAASPPSGGNE